MKQSSNKREVSISEDLIRKKAYELWLIRGSDDGRAECDWIEARNILEKEAVTSKISLSYLASVLHKPIKWSLKSMRKLTPGSDGIRLELWVAFFTVIGAASGGFIGSYLESLQWQRRANYESAIKLQDERLKLIERTVSILSKSQRAEALRTIISINTEEVSARAELCIDSINEGIDDISSICDFELSERDSPELHLELTNLTTEFSTTMSLSSLFFCDETRNVINSFINGSDLKWWEKPQEQRQNLLDTMAKELNCRSEGKTNVSQKPYSFLRGLV